MQVVATFSPHDKKLQKDIKDLEKEIKRRAHTKASTPTNATKPLPILTSERSLKDEALMKPLKTTIYKNKNASLDVTNDQHGSSEKTLPTNVEAPIASGARDSPHAEATAGSNTPTTTPPIALCERVASAKKVVTAVPQKPKTTLEFERTCGMLKENPKLAREYVKTIEVKKYPELFKESFTASILKCFVYVLRKGFMPRDAMVNNPPPLSHSKVQSHTMMEDFIFFVLLFVNIYP